MKSRYSVGEYLYKFLSFCVNDPYLAVIEIHLVLLVYQAHGMDVQLIRAIQDQVDIMFVGQDDIVENLHREFCEFHEPSGFFLDIFPVFLFQPFPYATRNVHALHGSGGRRAGPVFPGPSFVVL